MQDEQCCTCFLRQSTIPALSSFSELVIPEWFSTPAFLHRSSLVIVLSHDKRQAVLQRVSNLRSLFPLVSFPSSSDQQSWITYPLLMSHILGILDDVLSLEHSFHISVKSTIQ